MSCDMFVQIKLTYISVLIQVSGLLAGLPKELYWTLVKLVVIKVKARFFNSSLFKVFNTPTNIVTRMWHTPKCDTVLHLFKARFCNWIKNRPHIAL